MAGAPTGFSPGQDESPETITSSGSYVTPEPHGKHLITEAGAVGVRPVVTQPRRPAACVVASGNGPQLQHDNNLTTPVVFGATRAPSTYSVDSTDTLQDLLRERDLANKRKQVREAELKEMELEAEIANLS